ncbi:MAG: hypothetical protein FWC68_00850 [Oscillospiraceae bacterium]|nr:hypothetical protein [Oscillospiraceae bacterium]
MKTTETTKSKNKRKLALLLLLIAFCIIIGSTLAFFSDFVTGTMIAQTGTLDLRTTGLTSQRWWTNTAGEQNDTPGATIANLNPGDIVHVNLPVTNAGNKSAHLRNVVTLTAGENHADVQMNPAGVFEIFAPGTDLDITRAAIRAGTATPLTTTAVTNGFQVTTTPIILNGTGTAAETETGGVDGPVNAGFFIRFVPQTGATANTWQDTDLTLAVRTEGIQYRNNPAATVNWSNVTTVPFTLGTP